MTGRRDDTQLEKGLPVTARPSQDPAVMLHRRYARLRTSVPVLQTGPDRLERPAERPLAQEDSEVLLAHRVGVPDLRERPDIFELCLQYLPATRL